MTHPTCDYPSGTHRVCSLTYKAMLHTVSRHQTHVIETQPVQQCYPTDMLSAVLNNKTGELMEYRHLVANPTYHATWKYAYGKELG